jgi:hypothetical protein
MSPERQHPANEINKVRRAILVLAPTTNDAPLSRLNPTIQSREDAGTHPIQLTNNLVVQQLLPQATVTSTSDPLQRIACPCLPQRFLSIRRPVQGRTAEMRLCRRPCGSQPLPRSAVHVEGEFGKPNLNPAPSGTDIAASRPPGSGIIIDTSWQVLKRCESSKHISPRWRLAAVTDTRPSHELDAISGRTVLCSLNGKPHSSANVDGCLPLFEDSLPDRRRPSSSDAWPSPWRLLVEYVTKNALGSWHLPRQSYHT